MGAAPRRQLESSSAQRSPVAERLPGFFCVPISQKFSLAALAHPRRRATLTAAPIAAYSPRRQEPSRTCIAHVPAHWFGCQPTRSLGQGGCLDDSALSYTGKGALPPNPPPKGGRPPSVHPRYRSRAVPALPLGHPAPGRRGSLLEVSVNSQFEVSLNRPKLVGAPRRVLRTPGGTITNRR